MQTVIVKKLINNSLKPSEDPSTTSVAYDNMADRIDMINDLLGGTEAMRRSGELRMPRHPAETDKSYERRLQLGVLLNYFELTVEGLVGIPFSQGIALEEDVPEKIKEHSEDIDLCGNHLDVVARQWFKSGVAKGFAWMLIEHPPKKQREDGRARTREDDVKEGLRPYWKLIQPEDVLMVTVERVNGNQVITHFRFREFIKVRVGFDEAVIERIHVREPGRYELWEKREERKREYWFRIEDGEISIKKTVPVVPFYAGMPETVAEIKPPLLDLAYMNVAHWQSYADHRNILSVAQFPMLAASGIEATEDGSQLEVGPNQILSTESPDAKYYFVEHSGQAVEAGRRHIIDLEDKMSRFGADWLSQRPNYESATGRVIDKVESLSQLQSVIQLFKDAMELALMFHAEWIGEKDGGSINIRSDMGPHGYESAELMLLFTLYRAGLIDPKRMIAELQRRNVVDPDLPPEDIAKEGEAALLERIAKDLEPQFMKPEQKGPASTIEKSGAQKRQSRRLIGKSAGKDPLKR